MEFYRIIIADDHTSFREGLEMALVRLIPEATVFNATNGEQVIEILSKVQVDLIFLDVQIPGGDAVEIIKRIRQINKELKLVAVAMIEDKAMAAELFKIGINGYIPKYINKHLLQNLITAISNGDEFLSEEIII